MRFYIVPFVYFVFMQNECSHFVFVIILHNVYMWIDLNVDSIPAWNYFF